MVFKINNNEPGNFYSAVAWKESYNGLFVK